ncbi:MEDS domain-containing protein [Spirillospora sp. NPDC047279]|uniref:MEDS domain-containing protein n=1 Tax=Spirillospora sp. NPDC047279 TaxID=3155478 RepID=UPI0034058E84
METLVSVRRPVRELRPGDHALLAFANDEERRHVVGSFVRCGLEAGDKVIVLGESALRVTPPGTAPGTSPGTQGAGTRSPGLRVIPLEELGGPSCPPAAVGDALVREILRARQEGYETVRVTADLTWAVRRPGGLEPLLGSELQIERAIRPSTAVIAICCYDRRRCTPDELGSLHRSHDVLVGPDPEFDDTVLRIVRTFEPAGLALSGELDASRHTVLDRALGRLASSVNGREIHLDLAGLSFIDLGSINMLAETARRRAERGPLVLDRMSPQFRTVMETVGWHMMPGLRLGECPDRPTS